MKMSYRAVTGVLLAATVLAAAACDRSPPQGEPDRLSYAQINQELKRSKDWQQLVFDSPFQLGEPRREDEEGEAFYQVGYGDYPSIDGSTVALSMALEFARQHLGLSDEDALGFVSFSTTHYAYENLIFRQPAYNGMLPSKDYFIEGGHPVDLLIATEPSATELSMAQKAGVELIQQPVCLDAFVFITHRDNPVDSLTVGQIQQIYTGRITNWKQVGGLDQEMKAYQREANSGSQTAMEQLVMKGLRMTKPEKVRIISGMAGLVDAVAEYQNDTASIGYTYQYYIDTLYRNDQIKVLRVEGVAPTPDNLRGDVYPLTTRYYGVIRAADARNTGGRFLEWMLSETGQQCIALAGYLPLR